MDRVDYHEHPDDQDVDLAFAFDVIGQAFRKLQEQFMKDTLKLRQPVLIVGPRTMDRLINAFKGFQIPENLIVMDELNQLVDKPKPRINSSGPPASRRRDRWGR